MKKAYVLYISLLCLFLSCRESPQNARLQPDMPPQWAKEAIWYQIFVERFFNGDSTNDPTIASCKGALDVAIPSNWTITPWTHNWYKQEQWAEESGLDFYRTIQMRRYGGDLQGVMDKIPYLLDLGIDAIYFNPLNDAPSLHKYDARYYHHIDINFGPDPIGDLAIIESEDPADPATWKWTSADKLFLELIDSLHHHGIKVILDYSWNHTGREFWAFRDIQQNLSSSPYIDWYEGAITKDSATGLETFKYDGWHHHKSLPDWKKMNTANKLPGMPFDGNLHPDVKKHIFDVSSRWMDPYADGQIHRGIDGMRLDVAEHVPVGFWKEFRTYVRKLNPEFYLVGENWWKNWPHELMDASPWVQGDIFDAVMHYQWYKIARGFFAESEDGVSVDDFYFQMDSLLKKYPHYTSQVMMNLSASHDTPRLLTCFQNNGIYKYNCKPQENPDYLTGKPDTKTYKRIKLFLIHQFTFIGAPHIWNGDEMGMWGADDPDNRKPLWWHEYTFENETASTYSNFTYNQQIGFNEDLYGFYKSLIKLRKDNPALMHGELKLADQIHPNVVAYERSLGKDKIIVLFNRSNETIELKLPLNPIADKPLFAFNTAYKGLQEGRLTLNPLSSLVLKLK